MSHIATVIEGNFSDINPVQFGYENCKSSHYYGPAVRTHWLIHYVVSGSGIFKIGNKVYNVEKGQLFVIPPYVETYYAADNKNPWNYIWIGFTTNGKLPLKLEDTIYCPEAELIFQKMKNCIENENGRTAFLCARIWDLFSVLLENKNSEIDYVEKALSCIHSEYANDITVQQISDRLGLNRSYFSMIFKEKTGVSPVKYIVNYRMKIAASLMVKRSMNVTVAANSVGYTDIFNFSKMFKRYYGISPKKYIEQNSKQRCFYEKLCR